MDGRRFQNEAAPPAPGNPTGPLENQPQHKAYAIFDSLTTEKMGAELLERSQGDPGLYRGMVSWRELRWPHFKKRPQAAICNDALWPWIPFSCILWYIVNVRQRARSVRQTFHREVISWKKYARSS